MLVADNFARINRIVMAQNNEEPGKILAAVDDMIFAAKIRDAAARAGRRVEFAKSRDQLQRQIEGAGAPSLIILDLNLDRISPVALIAELKSNAKLREVPLVGFVSHVHTDLRRQAEAAGCTRVLPRSAFTQQLAVIVAGQLP